MAGIRKRKICVFIGMIFLACIVCFTASDLLKKDRTYSNTEERVLAQKPEYSTENLTDGTLAGQIESYLKDQFALRPFWSNIRTGFLRVMGQKESDGVYIGSNGYLLEENELQAGNCYQKNIKSIKTFCKSNKNLDVFMLIAPNGAEIMKSRLPSGAVDSAQRTWMKELEKQMDSSVIWIDAAETLREHASENLYYKTDSRWTTLGAYYAFQTAMDSLGIKSEHMIEYERYAVTEDFTGNLAAKSGFKRGKTEKIYMYVPTNDDTEYVAEYKDSGEKSASLYSSKALKTKKKYDVFLGGEQSEVRIRTTCADTSRLLVIKNDYANCFVPFLTSYYREIIVIDPVYYNGDLSQVIQDEQITDVLFLYDMNSFMKDESLYKIFGSSEDTAADQTEPDQTEPDQTGLNQYNMNQTGNETDEE